MKRLLVNITWLIMATPFYLMSLVNYAYLQFLRMLFDKIEKQEPYKLIEVLDSLVYKINTKL